MKRNRRIEPIERSAEALRSFAVSILLRCAGAVLFSSLGLSQSVSVEPQLTSTRVTPAAQQNAHNMRVSSDLVLIPVTVVDRHDSSIVGLEKEQFRLYQDNIAQVITHFSMEDAPMSVGFVFDASGSMTGKLWKSKEAVAKFFNIANPDDEFFLVAFNNRVELTVDITQDTQLLQRGLMSLQPQGETALLDGVMFSLQQIKKAHNSRKALIIVSDGGDNHSRYTFAEVKSAVREADVQMYAIGIYSRNGPPRSFEELIGPVLLKEITKDTAGRVFEIASVDELPEVASKISLALRNQYVLGYKPSSSHDGKYHRVRVSLALPKGHPKVQASWRHGYYAPID